MRSFRNEHGESVIPKGCYCYDKNGVCPYWEMIENIDEEEYHPINEENEEIGYCWFLEEGDHILLWDQCKICGKNDDEVEM